MQSKIVPLIAVGLLSGCASERQYAETLDAWLGSDANALVQQWGPPDDIRTAPDGGMTFMYQRVLAFDVPGVFPNEFGSTAAPVEIWCHIFFTLNPERKITRWRAEGSHCAGQP